MEAGPSFRRNQGRRGSRQQMEDIEEEEELNLEASYQEADQEEEAVRQEEIN